MMYLRHGVFLLCLFGAAALIAADEGVLTTEGRLQSVLQVVERYRSLPLVRMKVDKQVTYALMNKEKSSQGDLYFSKGRFRLRIQKPEKSLMILNNKTIWVENHVPEMDDLIQVSKFSTKNAKKQNALLAFLFDEIDVWHEFEVVDVKKDGNKKAYDLKPKADAGLEKLARLFVTVDTKSQHILSIGFKDELGSKTHFEFKKHQYAKTAPDKLFNYSPPKNAEVTVY